MIFNYLQQQWVANKSVQTLCLKNQVLNVIGTLLQAQDSSNQIFVMFVIYESIAEESELQLCESGMRLLLIYLQTINSSDSYQVD